MKAYLNEQTKLYELRDDGGSVAGLPKFKRFIGGIGWGREDKTGLFAKTWLSIFGEQEDDRVMQIAEEFGTLQAIGNAAIDWKDRLLCERFYMDGAEVHHLKILYLRILEGLTWYESEETAFGTERYITDTSRWKYFRSIRPTAAIVPVPDNIRADIAAGFSQLHLMATVERQIVFYGACEKLADLVLKSQIKDRKPEETYEHPLAQASVFAVSMLLRTREQPNQKDKEYQNPYPNMRRG